MAEVTRPDGESEADVWTRLRAWTPARIGLGRSGASLPTQALLDFDLAHARARDAVHAALDTELLLRDLRDSGFGDGLVVRSQARDRMEYLLRPDLGRTLDAASREELAERARQSPSCQLALVVADGLSAAAPQRHAIPLLRAMRPEHVTVVVASQARVALGDEIGQMLGADAAIVLIGERPGLSSPDSLGAYLTWAPRIGCTDAERNCISNIRPEGLPYAEAARRLTWLLGEARRLQQSGIALKDESDNSGVGSAFSTPARGPLLPDAGSV